MRPHVAVVGGGVSGLAAALDLAARANVTLLEAGPRLGGAIETVGFAGVALDSGPDSFLARRPEMTDLAIRLGLADDLVAPATGAAAVWSRGALHRLPPGLVLGVPSSLSALARSGIVSRRGMARAALDRLLPVTATGDDIGVGDLARRRLGAEVHERLVDPLLGGIHAGRSELLSAAVAAPQVLAASRRGRSLLRSLAAATPTADPVSPVFLTVPGGLGRIVAAASESLRVAGATIRLNARVGELRYRAEGVTLRLDDGIDIEADAVVIATPAATAAALLAGVAAEAAQLLRELRYASVALTLLAYRSGALRDPFTMSGFLVPRVEGKLLTAVSWSSSKWAHLGDTGTEIIRASTGRIDDQRAIGMSDEDVVERVHAELTDAVGLTESPTDSRVVRWPNALPQFAVGHAKRAVRIHGAVAADTPRLALAGAAYEGLGLPACVASGQAAAAKALAACTSARSR